MAVLEPATDKAIRIELLAGMHSLDTGITSYTIFKIFGASGDFMYPIVGPRFPIPLRDWLGNAHFLFISDTAEEYGHIGGIRRA